MKPARYGLITVASRFTGYGMVLAHRWWDFRERGLVRVMWTNASDASVTAHRKREIVKTAGVGEWVCLTMQQEVRHPKTQRMVRGARRENLRGRK